ncbi:hypothetical protein [Pectobacterium phage Lelidair]|uniref:Uncharacterized protein n=1 Tax=Pectobacterium phage Lelidair TaxID=2320195 RepID=A0A385IFJ5_9CAUD|nr:hypothetical protein HOU13_gp09 [Pectobacterium phage Lelidair]AXY81778.1 hypothetical protein [Pectobacterium phage Lelidair]
MRIPKSVIADAQESYYYYIAQGYKPSQAWSWVMVDMKQRYHAAKQRAIQYGFVIH